MTEENLARLRTHRNNIHRYRGLLRTQLTDLERGFIETRISEEMEAAKRLSNEPGWTWAVNPPLRSAGGRSPGIRRQ